MKNIWLLTKTNFKRNRIAVLSALGGAIVLCFMLVSIGKMAADASLLKLKLGIIDQDQSMLSQDFKGYLSEDLNCELMEEDNYDLLSTELIEKNISAIIEIPEGFYDKACIGILEQITITSTDDYENAAFLQAYLNSYMGSINMLIDSAEGDKEIFDHLLSTYEEESITLTQTAVQVIDMKAYAEEEGFNNSIGFFLMIIFGLGVFLSFIIVDDRKSGVFNRIKLTPVKSVQYITGTGIFGLLLGIIIVVIYSGYVLLTDTNIGIPIWLLVFMMSLISMFNVFFSMTIALATQSKTAIAAIIVGFSTIGAILGGAYFPLELAPKSFQNLARITPQFWYMDTIRSIQADAAANILPNIIILALFIILTFLIGAVLFSQNYKNS
ncbi:MAG TPA: ABC transporter permease [Mobilitalea sp.]|nr:ABC transporter permease [Mobilitalea sp.]